MKHFIKQFIPTFAFIVTATLFNACIEEEFDQPPTGGTDPGITANTTIKELKAKHVNGQKEVIQEDLVIKGIVVADDHTGNWFRTFVLQDETAGIEVSIDLADSYVFYPVGREIFIYCKGLVLSDYNNLVQLGGFIADDLSLGPIIDLTGHIVKGLKKEAPAPKIKKTNQLTMADVSTLITLENVQFITSDTGRTFADPVTRTSYNRMLEDCDFKQVIVRSSGYASFAGTSLPNGGGTFTGVLSVFRNDYQFLVRDLSDLEMDGSRCVFNPCAGTTVTEVTSLGQNFNTGANNADVVLPGWTNVAVKGSRKWIYKLFDGDVYVQATAFNDTAPQMESWLVTPGLKLDVPKLISFETAKAFWTHDALSVWISSDFVCDPTLATWQPLNCTLAKQSDADHAWVPSGEIDLSGYSGTVFVGFKYVGNNSAGQTVSYRVDNVVVKNK